MHWLCMLNATVYKMSGLHDQGRSAATALIMDVNPDRMLHCPVTGGTCEAALSASGFELPHAGGIRQSSWQSKSRPEH